MAKETHVPEFNLEKKVKLKKDNQEQEDEQIEDVLLTQLKVEDIGFSSKDLNAIKNLEINDDSNFHIEFIHAAANLRAKNFNLS